MFRIVTALSLASLAVSCRVGGGIGTGTGPSQPPPPPPPEDRGHSEGGAETGGGVAASADCPNPDNHCLPDASLYFAAKKEYKNNWVYVFPGDMRSEPDGAGEARFFLRKDGSELTTKWFYTTRPADPGELAVGQMIAMFHGNREDKIYRAPETRKDALGRNWWIGRITSVSPLESNGYVLVMGYKVGADTIRLIEGDKSPTTQVAGTEDEHYLKGGHWLISKRKPKERGFQYVQVGAPIAEPSAKTRGEGHFISAKDGKILWTAHAWQTRPATKQDLQLGKRVFIFHGNRENKVYQKPSSRERAVSRNWWTAKITDNSSLYKGVVTVAGKYEVAIDAVRVQR